MARITEFSIANFKGISKVRLRIGADGASPVTTLIGLNESGKTTVLEALSHFITGDSAVSSLFDGIHSKAEVASLIPVSKKANFTGEISIQAQIALDESDKDRLVEVAKKYKFELDRDELPDHITARKQYDYVDSSFKESSNYWDGLDLSVRKKRAKRYAAYTRPKQGSGEVDLWLKCVHVIQNSLPVIAYFPTFLVDMPKKIYLSAHPGETPPNKYYRSVFQDILSSLDGELDLQKHVVDRILKFKEEEGSSNWFSLFWGSANKAPVDSVFTKISSAVTKEVLGSWQKVFKRKISAKNVLVEWGVDTEKGDMPYATFAISDGESRYFISERSLGFRWFFSFLLFTAFKQQKKRATLFLFDEPAANLHAKAQSELLKSFVRTVMGGDRIIYSTHSHHMINPAWISGAQIVENTALDYDSDDDTFGLNTKPTDIVLTPYRHFVAQHPARTSYFQPVVDTLEYVTPEIIGSGPFVLVEGITDYYALMLAQRLSGRKYSYCLMPGVGAGAAGPQIGLLLGRGEKFVVLLDDDKAGRESAEKYRSDWYLSADCVLTLAGCGARFAGKKLENLLSPETKNSISLHHGIDRAPSKKQIGMYLAEAVAVNLPTPFSSKTLESLTELLDALAENPILGPR